MREALGPVREVVRGLPGYQSDADPVGVPAGIDRAENWDQDPAPVAWDQPGDLLKSMELPVGVTLDVAMEMAQGGA